MNHEEEQEIYQVEEELGSFEGYTQKRTYRKTGGNQPAIVRIQNNYRKL